MAALGIYSFGSGAAVRRGRSIARLFWRLRVFIPVRLPDGWGRREGHHLDQETALLSPRRPAISLTPATALWRRCMST